MANLENLHTQEIQQATPTKKEICYSWVKSRNTLNTQIQKESLLQERTIEDTIKFIKLAEWFEKKAYQDSKWIWTIWWWTIRINWKAVKKGDTITQVAAEKELRTDVAKRIKILTTKYPWFSTFNQNQKSAFISFSYNLWVGIFKKWKTLKAVLEDVDNSTQRDIAQIMMKYVYAGWKKIKWLKNRRSKEVALFLKPMTLEKNQVFSVIYKWDTLWKTLTRIIKEHDNNKNLDSWLLSLFLEEQHADIKPASLEAYQTILTEDLCDNKFNIKIAEKWSFIFDESIFKEWIQLRKLNREQEKPEEIEIASLPQVNNKDMKFSTEIENYEWILSTVEGKKWQWLWWLVANLIADFWEVALSEVLPNPWYDKILKDDIILTLTANNTIDINGIPIFHINEA